MFNKILKSALKKVNAKKIIILGNLKISRDVDYVYKFIYNVTYTFEILCNIIIIIKTCKQTIYHLISRHLPLNKTSFTT